MGKLAAILAIKYEAPGLSRVRFDFDSVIVSSLKRSPGPRWDPADRSWVIPDELLDKLKVVATARSFQIRHAVEELPAIPLSALSPNLFPYQAGGVQRLLARRRLLLNFEQGLGKSATFVEACRLRCAETDERALEHILIVCPAIVRRNWLREFVKWWPSCSHTPVVLEKGKDIAKFFASLDSEDPPAEPFLFVTSYELLAKLVEPLEKLELIAICIDESHYVKDYRAGRTRAVQTVLQQHPYAIQALLSGTPITNRPQDLYPQCDMLVPGCFSSWKRYTDHYCLKKFNGYADVITGLNPVTAPELNARLQAHSLRVTLQEVAHLMPPLRMTLERLPCPVAMNFRELHEKLTSGEMAQHKTLLDSVVASAGHEKIAPAVDFAANDIAGGLTHVALITYHKELGRQLAAACENDERFAGYTVVHVDGDTDTKKRDAAIETARKLEKCVFIATMSSIGIGVDLTFNQTATFVELYWTPAVISQAIKRFNRLTSQFSTLVRLLVQEGSLDEIIALQLEKRVLDINKVVRAGVAEEKVQEVLAAPELTDDEMFSAIQKACASRQEDAYL